MGVRFVGEGAECGGDFGQAGFGVDAGGVVFAVVAGVGAGDSVAVVAFDQVRVVWRIQWMLMFWAAPQGRWPPMRSQRWS